MKKRIQKKRLSTLMTSKRVTSNRAETLAKYAWCICRTTKCSKVRSKMPANIADFYRYLYFTMYTLSNDGHHQYQLHTDFYPVVNHKIHQPNIAAIWYIKYYNTHCKSAILSRSNLIRLGKINHRRYIIIVNTVSKADTSRGFMIIDLYRKVLYDMDIHLRIIRKKPLLEQISYNKWDGDTSYARLAEMSNSFGFDETTADSLKSSILCLIKKEIENHSDKFQHYYDFLFTVLHENSEPGY